MATIKMPVCIRSEYVTIRRAPLSFQSGGKEAPPVPGEHTACRQSTAPDYKIPQHAQNSKPPPGPFTGRAGALSMYGSLYECYLQQLR